MMNVLQLYPRRNNADTATVPASPTAAEPTDAASIGSPEHRSGLDGVRAFAALGVVLLHACVPYLRHPMPGLTWSVTDTSSEVADLAFWSIELFIMPVFLVIAGFLLTPTLVRRGPLEMLRVRWKRLARPLAFGVLVILPLDFYLWLCGWVSEGIIPLVKLKSLKFDGDVDKDLWGLSHLWFMLYLLTYITLVAWVAFAAKRTSMIAKIVRRWQQPQWLLPLLAVIAVLTITVRPEVVWGFQHRFEPVPSKWLYSLLFFVAGLAWANHDPQLRQLACCARPRWFALSLVVGMAAVVMGRWHLEAVDTDRETIASQLLLAGLTVSGAVMITVSAIAWATARLRRVPKSVTYLAGASFWLYLMHHPLLVLLHIDLKWWLPTTPSVVKVLVSFALAVAGSLVLYEVGVRRTRFGRWTGLGETASTSLPNATGEAVLVLPQRIEPTTPQQRAA